MSLFLGILVSLELAFGTSTGKSAVRCHYALMALLVIGCFLAWALDRGFIS